MQEKTIVIDVHLSRRAFVLGLVLLLATGFVAAMALQQPAVSASTVAGGQRQYYITDLSYFPDEAPTACGVGYHFASLWEIVDPSNFIYDTSLGQTTLDSGNGPPTIQGLGWVRTGYNFSDGSATPGHANCLLWSSRSSGDNGSVAVLPQIWTTSPDVGIWTADVRACNFKLGVWCVED